MSKNKDIDFSVVTLANKKDWHDCKDELEELESRSEISPWTSWYNYYNILTFAYPDEKYWLVRIYNKKQLIGAGIFREEARQKLKIKSHILRTVDWNSMFVSPLIVDKDQSKTAYKALSQNLNRLGKETGAFQLCLFLQTPDYTCDFIDSLVERKIAFRDKRTSFYQIIDIDKWFAKTKIKKKTKIMVRNEKRIEDKSGKKGEFVRFRGDVIDELRQNGIWQQFIDLYQRSWQHDFLVKQDQNSIEKLVGVLEKDVEYWSKRGCLDICAYMIDGQLSSIYYNIVTGNYVWLIITCYDPEYEDFGIGTINLLKMILDSNERGDKFLNFGAEAIVWKRRWSTTEEPQCLISVPLGGLLSCASTLKDALKPKINQEIGVVSHVVQSKQEALEQGKSNLSVDALNSKVSIRKLGSLSSLQKDASEFVKLVRKSDLFESKQVDKMLREMKDHRESEYWLLEVNMPLGRQKGLIASMLLEAKEEKIKFKSRKVLKPIKDKDIEQLSIVTHKDFTKEASRFILDVMPELFEASEAFSITIVDSDKSRIPLFDMELRYRYIDHKIAGSKVQISKGNILPDPVKLYRGFKP